MEYYSATPPSPKEISDNHWPYVTIIMNLEDMMLSGMNQSQKDKDGMMPLLRGL